MVDDGAIVAHGLLAPATVNANDVGPDCQIPEYRDTHTESTGQGAVGATFVMSDPVFVRLEYSAHRAGSGGGVLPEVCTQCNYGCTGDVNGDGNADQDDITAVIDCVAGAGSLRCCDVNGDGNTDQDDIAEVINRVSGGGC